MNLPNPDKDIHFDKREVFDTTAELTYEVLCELMASPHHNKERIIEVLQMDYKLIHLLTKRYNMK